MGVVLPDTSLEDQLDLTLTSNESFGDLTNASDVAGIVLHCFNTLIRIFEFNTAGQ